MTKQILLKNRTLFGATTMSYVSKHDVARPAPPLDYPHWPEMAP